MTRAFGIDVSFYDDNNATPQKVDWQKAKRNGVTFTYVKASQKNYMDQDFPDFWRDAKSAGILRGAYHLYDYREPASSIQQQADTFINLIQAEPGELPPALDFEPILDSPPPPRDKFRSDAIELINRVEQRLGKQVAFYSNPSTLSYLAPLPSWMSSRVLWIAYYSSTPPTAAQIMPWGMWHFWQFSESGYGIDYGTESSEADFNWFYGTEAELFDFAHLAPVDLVQRYFRSLNAKDTDQLSALYSPTGIHVTPSQTVQGSLAIREWYANFLTTSFPNAVFSQVTSTGSSTSRVITWTGVSPAGRINNGKDVLGIVNEKIVFHTTSFTITH